MAPRRRPVRTFTANARELMVRLHADGKSLNAIARELGYAPATISKHAKLTGLRFDRAQTKAAVKAREVDLAAMRARVSEKSIMLADRLLDKIEAEYTLAGFTKDGSPVTQTLDAPPAGDVRNYAAAYGILFDKHLAGARFDGDMSGTEKSMLAELGRALGIQ